jgi:hypothetical protein
MDDRRTLWIAVATNCLVAATTLLIYGWNTTGAHAATRNTARCSALWFTFAFAVPGLVRWVRGLPSRTGLIYSFVGAHAVHFAAVLLLLATFELGHVREHPGQTAGVAFSGFSIILIAALTAARSSRVRGVINEIALDLVFLIFFSAFLRNPVKPLRVISLGLGLALVLRVAAAVSLYRMRMRTAS